MVTVRPASAADATAIGTVHVRTWQAAYAGLMPADALAALDIADRAAFWRRVISVRADPAALFVAESGGEVVGFASVGRSGPADGAEPPAGQVYAIYVTPGQWSTGAGLALMRASVEHLGAQGFTEIRLWVLDTNERARRFYERFGFAPDGVEQLDDQFAGMPPLREVRYVLPLG
jgi:ribosomal protein S18 acetylase RimI-like enzyme